MIYEANHRTGMVADLQPKVSWQPFDDDVPWSGGHGGMLDFFCKLQEGRRVNIPATSK